MKDKKRKERKWNKKQISVIWLSVQTKKVIRPQKRKPCFTGPTDPDFPILETFFSLLNHVKSVNFWPNSKKIWLKIFENTWEYFFHNFSLKNVRLLEIFVFFFSGSFLGTATVVKKRHDSPFYNILGTYNFHWVPLDCQMSPPPQLSQKDFIWTGYSEQLLPIMFVSLIQSSTRIRETLAE